jgi:hypothetical protein
MGDKQAKEDCNRYVLCDAAALIGRYPDEPKWSMVRDFFEEESLPFITYSYDEIPDIECFNPDTATVVIFEDLVDAPKKIQEKIAGYFTHGRHRNLSCIYVSQRFFAIPKIIRENVNYISLHGGHGSLDDTKQIIRRYTEESESLAPLIDDLTLQREFVVFDLRRSKSDPLSVRVRWDTSLRSILDQSNIDQKCIQVLSNTKPNDHSKFTSYGQKAVSEAKKAGQLVKFARNFPSPTERKVLLIASIQGKVKNSDIWARYVFREAYGIESKDLGDDWKKFIFEVRRNIPLEEVSTSHESNPAKLFAQYKKITSTQPLSDEKIIEGIEILLQLFSKGCADRKTLRLGIENLFLLK